MIDEYLNYIDVMLYGTEEEKYNQSFELLDENNTGKLGFYEFRKIVSSFAQMWSAALGQPSMISSFTFDLNHSYIAPINPRWIDKIFFTLSDGKDYFDYNE